MELARLARLSKARAWVFCSSAPGAQPALPRGDTVSEGLQSKFFLALLNIPYSSPVEYF